MLYSIDSGTIVYVRYDEGQKVRYLGALEAGVIVAIHDLKTNALIPQDVPNPEDD